MVKINKIQEPVVPLYGPKGLIGYISDCLEFIDVRLQIKKQSLKGYYIIFNDEKVNINHKGSCSKWPKGMFDKMDDLLIEIIKLNRNDYKRFNN